MSNSPGVPLTPPQPPPSTTQTMLSPGGTVADIPVERVQDAVSQGFKMGHDMVSPNGVAATIPLDRVE